ncbi:MAG: hypothetical protein AAF250_04130 [Pseudomonadota bacterium]
MTKIERGYAWVRLGLLLACPCPTLSAFVGAMPANAHKRGVTTARQGRVLSIRGDQNEPAAAFTIRPTILAKGEQKLTECGLASSACKRAVKRMRTAVPSIRSLVGINHPAFLAEFYDAHRFNARRTLCIGRDKAVFDDIYESDERN